MDKLFNLNSTFKSEPQEDGSVMVRGMASTRDFDRAGDSIMAEAWTKGGLGNFEKNPIILFNHDYSKPIGRATKVTPTADGLHMEAKISKHAECADLIKDGVLGAFSVGFKVKDADYLEETDGLQIKDAELFEVSVVSIPCNQAATFSLAKSFESKEAYEDFKKTFKSEEDSSSMETDMSEETQTPEIDLDAFAKKVAEETAAKIAIRQAEEKAAAQAEAQAAQEAEEQKAAEEAEAQKAAVEQQEQVESSIRTGIESGTERLVEDLRKEFTAKDAETQEIIEKYKAELEEKAAEIQAITNSKMSFSDRGADSFNSERDGSKILDAKIFNEISRKGWDSGVLEKLGVNITPTSGVNITLDTEVNTQFERELQLELKTANLFREIQVNTVQTVLPLMPDSQKATFGNGSPTGTANQAPDLEESLNGGARAAAGAFQLDGSKVLTVGRMTSTTYVNNETDENTLITILPMLREGMVRAHARAIEDMVIQGVGGSGAGANGVRDAATVGSTTPLNIANVASSGDRLKGSDILVARADMKKYGLNPADLALVCSYSAYNDLLQDTDFHDITEVGSELAIKLTGTMGTIFSIPVIVTDMGGLSNDKSGDNVCACLFNVRNFVIPRMRGVNIETEYQVANQRSALVASQTLGFERLFDGAAAVGLTAREIRYTTALA